MASSTMTMIGLYNYDPTVFDNLNFPTGIDKDLAVNQILMSCGEFEVLYPNLEFMKYQIGMWGDKNRFTFEKWVRALSEDFNPIHNYDRYEEYEDEHNTDTSDSTKTNTVNSGSATNNISANNKAASSNVNSSDVTGNAATSNTAQTDNDVEVTRDVSAYDSATYEPKEKETTDGGNTVSGSAITNENTKTTGSNVSNTEYTSNTEETSSTTGTSNNQTIGSKNEKEIVKHNAHLYGNIGVTTSVAMLTEFTNFYKDFNLYEQIADLFVNDFCIRIY